MEPALTDDPGRYPRPEAIKLIQRQTGATPEHAEFIYEVGTGRLPSGDRVMLDNNGEEVDSRELDADGIPPGDDDSDQDDIQMARTAEYADEIRFARQDARRRGLVKSAAAPLELRNYVATLAQRVEKGDDHGESIKCPDIYEALRREGKTKRAAARISNAMRLKGWSCH